MRKLNKNELYFYYDQTLKYGMHDVKVKAITIILGRIYLTLKPLNDYSTLINIYADDYNFYDNGEIRRKFVYTE